MFLPKIAFRKPLLSGWVETFVAWYWCRWKVQDMAVRVVFFILKLVRKFLSDSELNTAWNREKIAMSQGFARYWVTLNYKSAVISMYYIHKTFKLVVGHVHTLIWLISVIRLGDVHRSVFFPDLLLDLKNNYPRSGYAVPRSGYAIDWLRLSEKHACVYWPLSPK